MLGNAMTLNFTEFTGTPSPRPSATSISWPARYPDSAPASHHPGEDGFTPLTTISAGRSLMVDTAVNHGEKQMHGIRDMRGPRRARATAIGAAPEGAAPEGGRRSW